MYYIRNYCYTVRRSVPNYGVNFCCIVHVYDHIIMSEAVGRMNDVGVIASIRTVTK